MLHMFKHTAKCHHVQVCLTSHRCSADDSYWTHPICDAPNTASILDQANAEHETAYHQHITPITIFRFLEYHVLRIPSTVFLLEASGAFPSQSVLSAPACLPAFPSRSRWCPEYVISNSWIKHLSWLEYWCYGGRERELLYLPPIKLPSLLSRRHHSPRQGRGNTKAEMGMNEWWLAVTVLLELLSPVTLSAYYHYDERGQFKRRSSMHWLSRVPFNGQSFTNTERLIGGISCSLISVHVTIHCLSLGISCLATGRSNPRQRE